MKRLFLSMLALIFLPFSGAIAVAQSAGVNGDWEVTLNTPNGPRNAKAAFRQDGEKLSGVFKSERGEVPFRGTIKGKEIKLTYAVKYQDNDLLITLTGSIDGASMTGKADFGGFAEGDWTAKRLVEGAVGADKTPASVASSEQKIDVSGVWTVEVETPQGAASPTFTFKQEGENLTGQYKGSLNEGPLTGTVRGNQIQFSFKVPDADAAFTFTGTIEKNAMKGTVQLGGFGSGTWTAKRQ
jgi:hypothetical protein